MPITLQMYFVQGSDELDNEECKKMITRTFQRTLDIRLGGGIHAQDTLSHS